MTMLAKDCDFSPYAQLVAALLPRAGGVTVFEPDGQLRWTSEEAIGPAALKLVMTSAINAEKSTEAGESLQNSQNEPVYLFWLRDEANALIGIFSVSWRSSERDPRSFSYVHAMLRPVLECLRRELVLRDRCSDAARTAVAEGDGVADLQVLLTSEADQQDGASDGVRNLLQSVTKHMQCEYAALMMPDRNLVAVTKAEGREVDTSGLAKIHRHLLSLAQMRNETALLNDPDSLPGVKLTQRVLSAPIRNRAGRPAGVLVLFRSRESSEFRRRDAMLADLLARRAASIIDSSYDALSGLLTHKVFEQRAQTLLAQRAAERSLRWSCLHINTDHMHAINDNHGMHVGDQLLARLGELIRARLVPGALAARIVGGSFAILLPTTEEEAAGFAESLRAGAEALTGAQLGATDASLRASISIGVATSNESRVELASLLSMADTACKMAEDRGFNRVETFKAGDESVTRRSEDEDGEEALRAVISNNRLRLDAQLMAPTGGTEARTPHFELLLRVLDDNGAAVAPGRFMSGAARYQLMPAVDRWVVGEALRQLAPHAALLASSPVIFNINLSGQSLGDAGFADFVIEQITGSGIPAQAFCFELAESAAAGSLAQAETLMKRLREGGCAVALDNFGTGVSSLSHLRTLPVSMLKIDGSFVRDVLKDPRAESMVQAMTQLAHSMNLVTVAQYVETDEIRLRVAKLGVDYGQGFAIARPAPLADAIRDLPTYVSVATRASDEEAEPDDGDSSLSAELEQQLLDAGIEITDHEDTIARMEKVLAGYDHSESTLYQGKRCR